MGLQSTSSRKVQFEVRKLIWLLIMATVHGFAPDSRAMTSGSVKLLNSAQEEAARELVKMQRQFMDERRARMKRMAADDAAVDSNLASKKR